MGTETYNAGKAYSRLGSVNSIVENLIELYHTYVTFAEDHPNKKVLRKHLVTFDMDWKIEAYKALIRTADHYGDKGEKKLASQLDTYSSNLLEEFIMPYIVHYWEEVPGISHKASPAKRKTDTDKTHILNKDASDNIQKASPVTPISGSEIEKIAHSYGLMRLSNALHDYVENIIGNKQVAEQKARYLISAPLELKKDLYHFLIEVSEDMKKRGMRYEAEDTAYYTEILRDIFILPEIAPLTVIDQPPFDNELDSIKRISGIMPIDQKEFAKISRKN